MKNKKTMKTKHNFFQKLNDKRKKLVLIVGMFIVTNMMTALTAFADTSGGGGLSADTGKAQFSELINFFAVWMQRIGAVVALVGAGMFAFANKSDDPEGRQRGINTMVSGIMVFAIFAAADWFINLA